MRSNALCRPLMSTAQSTRLTQWNRMDLALPPHMDEFAIEGFIGREVEGEVYERSGPATSSGGGASRTSSLARDAPVSISPGKIDATKKCPQRKSSVRR